MNAPVKQRRLARRIFKGLVVLAMLGVLGVAALLGSLWLEHRTDGHIADTHGNIRGRPRGVRLGRQ